MSSYYVIQNQTATGQQVTTGPTILFGFSITELTGTGDAEVDIFDGTALATGKWITGFNGSANESQHRSFGPDGIMLSSGLLVNLLVGQAGGIVIYG